VTKAETEVQEGLNIMSWEAEDARKLRIQAEFEALLARANERLPSANGVLCRFRNPVLTRDHVRLTGDLISRIEQIRASWNDSV